jgi:PAB-dependent poly(A)-specific ribonuclease subunit 2
MPVVLYYSRVDILDLMDTSGLPSEIDQTILFKDISISKLVLRILFVLTKINLLIFFDLLNRHHTTNKKSSVLLTPEELPQPGTLVAIDAEFVALNQVNLFFLRKLFMTYA